MSKLKDFLKELGTNAELLESYKQNPKQTMEDYGLTSNEIKAVYELDMDKIKKIIGDECDYITVIFNQNEHGM